MDRSKVGRYAETNSNTEENPRKTRVVENQYLEKPFRKSDIQFESEFEKTNERIYHLEKQVQLMRQELRYIRQNLIPKKDLLRLSNLSDKLKELNNLLQDLRYKFNSLKHPNKTRYNREKLIKLRETHLSKPKHLQERQHNTERYTNFQSKQQIGKEVTDFSEPEIELGGRNKEDRTEQQLKENEFSESETEDNVFNKYYKNLNEGHKNSKDHKALEEGRPKSNELNKSNKYTPLKTCKQLMDDMKPPVSILGNHIMRLQDFRTDPELRRQRLEKKQQEKLKQIQSETSKISIHKNDEENTNKVTAKNSQITNLSKTSSRSEIQEDFQHLSNTSKSYHQPDTETGICRIIEWDNTPIPSETSKAAQQTQSDSTLSSLTTWDPPQNQYCTGEPIKLQTKFSHFNENYQDKLKHDDNDTSTKPLFSQNIESVSEPQSSSQHSYGASNLPKNLPLLQKNLSDVIYSIIQNIDHDVIALTVVLEADNLYHINISIIPTAQSLACLYATGSAVQQAKTENLFKNLLTFFVMNSDNTLAQKDCILGHSFEFIEKGI